MDLVKISPESMEVANAYLTEGSAEKAALKLSVPESVVHANLAKREVKKYIDAVFLDQGYRNRSKLAETLDLIIEKKLEEAEETEMYSSKDLADLISLAHKMRLDELKLIQEREKTAGPTHQQNNQFNFGGGNYGKLMEKLMSE